VHQSPGYILHHCPELEQVDHSKDYDTQSRPVVDCRYQSNGNLTIGQSQSGDKPWPFDKPGDDTDNGSYEEDYGRNLGDRFSLHGLVLLFYLIEWIFYAREARDRVSAPDGLSLWIFLIFTGSLDII
jgi:hypothetical protein